MSDHDRRGLDGQRVSKGKRRKPERRGPLPDMREVYDL